MRKYVRLIAPPGTDECNFGETRFKVHDDQTVIVPVEAARDLMHGAGFAIAPEDQQPVDDYEPTVEKH
jgi:hypothetical protein